MMDLQRSQPKVDRQTLLAQNKAAAERKKADALARRTTPAKTAAKSSALVKTPSTKSPASKTPVVKSPAVIDVVGPTVATR